MGVSAYAYYAPHSYISANFVPLYGLGQAVAVYILGLYISKRHLSSVEEKPSFLKLLNIFSIGQTTTCRVQVIALQRYQFLISF